VGKIIHFLHLVKWVYEMRGTLRYGKPNKTNIALCPAKNGWNFLEVGRAENRNWSFNLSCYQNKKLGKLYVLFPIRLHEVFLNWARIELKCNNQSLFTCVYNTRNAYLSYIYSCAKKRRRLHFLKIYKLCVGFQNQTSSLWHNDAAFKIPVKEIFYKKRNTKYVQ
jgi:hypothetical protein